MTVWRDFVAPRVSGKPDYIGGFACTAGIGINDKVAEFEADHDDYSSLMLKALADRLAEALAEWLHHEVRTGIWGYAGGRRPEQGGPGRRALPGYSPRHGLSGFAGSQRKRPAMGLLDAEANTGIWLTESKAMVPTAAVSGLYLSHPELSRYFAVSKLNRDQVEDYALRKGMELARVEKWLGPNLAYDPDS